MNNMMNIQILPNWCKKVGFTFFCLGIVLMLIYVMEPIFADSLDSARERGAQTGKRVAEFLFRPLENESRLVYFAKLIMIVGVAAFMLAKEKFEDEYMIKLRMESYQLTLFLLVIIYVLCLVFNVLRAFSDFFIFLFFAIYLLLFYLKRE